MEKKVTGQLERENWIAIWLAILGTLLYGVSLFQYDYFQVLKRGENGQAAIEMLDQMRRPFLALRQIELRQLQSNGGSSSISGLESAIHDGSRKLSEYLEVTSYNEAVREKVVPLQASYERWVSLELELMSTRASLMTNPSMSAEQHNELDALVYRNASSFLTVMDVLGHGEKPIHHDIEAGAAAVRGLLKSSLTFIIYLIAVLFWREWMSHRRECRRYENDLRLYSMAHKDSLTGLANRTLFDDRISVAIAAAHRYGHRLGIFYIDLDGFKDVNDELGHDAGDFVLKEVALRLKMHARKMDTVARIGGDEFVVLMTNLSDISDARVGADKLQAVLNQPFELRGKPYLLRASIGISIFPDDGDHPTQLIKHADTAMYEAKRVAKLNNGALQTKSGLSYSTGQWIT
jgi:diguanylate cyclase (GGDEF)-like protein